ncbi:Metallopeptidase toxin 3 [Aliiruegeria lutimaris]|uniref:Metallopeptidase toxin 3 n=2 Tax=Aliiruegeria lutimaris TaxID=571298 RepID=A0A1G9H338_9RHOB|nr:Metallopeptidase toxin 3 [Aliiruegeria lutimaris]
MMVSQKMKTSYPKLSAWIYDNLAKVPKNKKVFDAFVKYTEQKRGDMRAMLTTCSPTPIVDCRAMENANGEFSGGTDPNRVYIDVGICEKFEKSASDAKDPRMHILLESTLLHEMVHWGDWKDGKDQEYEEGKEFEKEAYGKDINRYW